uniref:DNA-directed RNA polymerase n=1 Tax=Gymnema sylvestre TaxID=4068 RepID=A0A976RV18_GYMSY|nr:TCP family protein [Gymnema sylvestre]
MKEILLTKRNDHSFRMVVVGDPSLKLGEIGVPCQIAEKLRVAEYVNDLNLNELVEKDVPLMLLGDGDLRVRRGGKLMRLSIEDKLQKGDVLYRPLSNGDILLINRPPSIHQHSILALSVKILPISYVLAINPHVCSPLRGDFDGDCLHGYIPQSVNSRIELSELVALSKQLINGQSGKNLLSLSHDSLTAAHLVLEDGVTLNKVQMQQLQMFCTHQMQLPAIMKTNLANSSFWTGKQLLSLCLPPDFNYTFPSNGVLIRKGEILTASNGSSWLRDTDGNLFYDLIKHCKEEFLDYLFAAQEVLREWLSMRGLSVSLSDLYLASDRCLRENMIDEVSCGLQEAELQSYISFLMLDHDQDFPFASCNVNDKVVNSATRHMSIQQQASAPIGQASISAFKQVFMDIQHLACQYASKDNAFLIMLKAGSKGSLLKLVQHSLCLGLQNSVVPLSFGIPHRLSCAEWNDHKVSHRKAHGILGHSESYTAWAAVESSFLTGLNPLECFVHSLTNRDSSFGGHADVSGTINRRITYFMRDLYVAYDGTVRNAYGNHLVQFSYNNSKDIPTSFSGNNLEPHGVNCATEGGHPVGSLAASAISEAAYSALELPCSALETSPLLNLKKVLECGVKKSSGDMTASLFLSKKLGRWHYGFEYGALEVKSHLERLLFSEIVSSTMISFSSETSRHFHASPWVCHFHISKGTVKTKRLRVQSIIQALHMQWYSAKAKLKNTLPQLQITSKVCSLAENETDAKLCITVSVSESSRNSSVQWEALREMVIPFLLGTVVKGFSEFKKVDILWKDANPSKLCKGTPNGLYLRVYMSESCDKTKFWGTLEDCCLQIRAMIDWECSHPDDVNHMTLAYGIDAAWMLFVNRLNSAICDTGKTLLPEHLVLTADCLVATGEFVALNAKGLGQQRKEINVSSPLNQACFSSPGDCFIRAAKKGVVDNLQGTLDALAWGKTPRIGTGADFDIIYSCKGNELMKPTNVYSLLDSHCQEAPKIKFPKKQNEMSAKSLAQHLFEDLTTMTHRKLMISKTLKLKLSLKDIQRLSQTLRNLLHKYDIDTHLNEEDKAVVVAALYFHPRKSEKIGTGIMDIKVGSHAKHENSRCFILERKDGTLEDFSYHKCVHRALQLIAPKRAENYETKWLQGSLEKGQVASVPPSWKSLL